MKKNTRAKEFQGSLMTKKDVDSELLSWDIKMTHEPLLSQAGREECNMNLVQGTIMKRVWWEENDCKGID